MSRVSAIRGNHGARQCHARSWFSIAAKDAWRGGSPGMAVWCDRTAFLGGSLTVLHAGPGGWSTNLDSCPTFLSKRKAITINESASRQLIVLDRDMKSGRVARSLVSALPTHPRNGRSIRSASTHHVSLHAESGGQVAQGDRAHPVDSNPPSSPMNETVFSTEGPSEQGDVMLEDASIAPRIDGEPPGAIGNSQHDQDSARSRAFDNSATSWGHRGIETLSTNASTQVADSVLEELENGISRKSQLLDELVGLVLKLQSNEREEVHFWRAAFARLSQTPTVPGDSESDLHHWKERCWYLEDRIRHLESPPVGARESDPGWSPATAESSLDWDRDHLLAELERLQQENQRLSPAASTLDSQVSRLDASTSSISDARIPSTAALGSLETFLDLHSTLVAERAGFVRSHELDEGNHESTPTASLIRNLVSGEAPESPVSESTILETSGLTQLATLVAENHSLRELLEQATQQLNEIERIPRPSIDEPPVSPIAHSSVASAADLEELHELRRREAEYAETIVRLQAELATARSSPSPTDGQTSVGLDQSSTAEETQRLRDDVQTLYELLAERSRDLGQLETELQAAQSKLSQSVSLPEVVMLRNRLIESENDSLNLSEQLRQVVEQSERQEAELVQFRGLSNELDQLRSLNRDQELELASLRERVQASSTTEVGPSDAQVEAIEASRAAAAESESLRVQLRERSEELLLLREQLERQVGNRAEHAEVEQAIIASKEMAEALEQARSLANSQSRQLRSLEEQVARITHDHEHARAELFTRERELSSAQTRLILMADQQKELDRLRHELQKAVQRENELQVIWQEARTPHAISSEMLEELHRLRAEVNELADKNATLSREVDDARRLLAGKEVSGYRASGNSRDRSEPLAATMTALPESESESSAKAGAATIARSRSLTINLNPMTSDSTGVNDLINQLTIDERIRAFREHLQDIHERETGRGKGSRGFLHRLFARRSG